MRGDEARTVDVKLAPYELSIWPTYMELSLGVPQNYPEAHRWLQEAADKGDGDAMLVLSRLHREGLGTRPSRLQARLWLEKAATAGNAEGIIMLVGVSGDTAVDFSAEPFGSRKILSERLQRSPPNPASPRCGSAKCRRRPSLLTFDADDVAQGTIKRTDTSSFAEAAVSSLLKDLHLDVQALGLSVVPPDAITGAVADSLAPIAKPLDAVVYTLLTTLGVHLGEADFKVHGMHCGSGVLAG